MITDEALMALVRQAGGTPDTLANGRNDGICFTPLELRNFVALLSTQSGSQVNADTPMDDASCFRWLMDKLQKAYDGEALETQHVSVYCHMQSNWHGERTVQAQLHWRDETDLPLNLAQAIARVESSKQSS